MMPFFSQMLLTWAGFMGNDIYRYCADVTESTPDIGNIQYAKHVLRGIESTLAAILIKNNTITFSISQGEQHMTTFISRRTTHDHIH
jgi:hypothetical protein